MLKTIRISFSLRITYKVNAILHAIRQTPLIKRLIPSNVYAIDGFKIFAEILAVIWELITVFFGKLLYFLLILLTAAFTLLGDAETFPPTLFPHIIICLSAVGAILNNSMFNPTNDKRYAILSLGMDARMVVLADYFYKLAKSAVGFFVLTPLFGLAMDAPIGLCFLVPFFVVGLKLTYAALKLSMYERFGNDEPRWAGALSIALLVLLIVAAYLPPLIFGVTLPIFASAAIMAFSILSGALSAKRIVGFAHYRSMYREMFAQMPAEQKSATEVVRESVGELSVDCGQTSTKRGFEYLTEIFVMRHKKLLWKAVKSISIVAATLTAILCLLINVIPDIRPEINEIALSIMPILPFAMYAINRGTGFTNALFVNCDRALLTYPFFKTRGSILKLFAIRLREIVKINLLPSAVIGVCLDLILFLSGGCENPVYYALLFVTVNALSVFFSVHYLTLYYLLQPYNAGTEVKAGSYTLASGATYFVCYFIMNLEVSPMMFGIASVAFCVAYCLIACALVYRFAPKRFRIRA